jgi:signal transduction histidine kinase
MFGRRRPDSHADEPRSSAFTGLTIRTALLLGFGLTFGIWVFAAFYFTRRIAEVEGRSAAINARYLQAQETLSTVRTQILLGSVYVRDALLDPDPTTASDYRRSLEDSCHAADQALAQYVPVMGTPAEREQIAQLRWEVADFRTSMLQVLAPDTQRSRDARTLLRTEIVPRREVVIRVSEQVQALNRSAFVRQQTDSAEMYRVSQRRTWQTLGFALAASLGIGLLATLYAARLEERLRRRRLADAQHALELQGLSAKLIRAQEEERRSIARELHDEVGQVLSTIKVELAVAQHAIESTGGASHLLDDARSVTDGALATVRDLSQLLHPALLDDLGLASAVDWYLRGFGKRHGLQVDVLSDRMDERFSRETETSAFRIIQEALTNVANHARARTCRVYLQRLPNTVLITVEDDGAGFDPATTQGTDGRRGLGLISIRERVAELHGTLRLESAPGKGTRLTVEVPARARVRPAITESVDALSAEPTSLTPQVLDG